MHFYLGPGDGIERNGRYPLASDRNRHLLKYLNVRLFSRISDYLPPWLKRRRNSGSLNTKSFRLKMSKLKIGCSCENDRKMSKMLKKSRGDFSSEVEKLAHHKPSPNSGSALVLICEVFSFSTA